MPRAVRGPGLDVHDSLADGRADAHLQDSQGWLPRMRERASQEAGGLRENAAELVIRLAAAWSF